MFDFNSVDVLILLLFYLLLFGYCVIVDCGVGDLFGFSMIAFVLLFYVASCVVC